ncbi:mitochondrial escape protein 2 [Naganishia cerealis]|uniref:Mitochondrial escape protein 2 n=1 Tax=Naganishia cerealis TaxID=610337 RepID=A0ACC2VFP0_9TREE|nr:mitochondrial escape protein 2 [Naganishia cerealis]
MIRTFATIANRGPGIRLATLAASRNLGYSSGGRISSVRIEKLRFSPFRSSTSLRYTSDIQHVMQEADSLDVNNSVSNTGVLDYDRKNAVVLYFDHIYPFSVSRYSWKQYFTLLFPVNRCSEDDIRERVMNLSSTEKEPLPKDVRILELVPMRRDGGVFVKFQLPATMSARELVGLICQNTKENEQAYGERFLVGPLNKIWNHFPRCFQVKGTPWIEDLRRFPSVKLLVKFEGERLTEEELYVLFRRYGLIIDIAPGSGTEPAVIHFRKIRSAICAKNCVTGITLNSGNTVVHIQYLPLKRVNYITDFIGNHQRIAIPIILALLATAAVFIFDPIREWFIMQNVSHRHALDSYKDNKFLKLVSLPYEQVRRWIDLGYDYFDLKFGCDEEDEFGGEKGEAPNDLWSERYEKVKQLKLWIYENINTFIIVRGPKGSGKEELVLEHTLRDDPVLGNKLLYIDCEALVKSRSDNALIEATAQQLGYFPVFTWTNSISQFVDLGVQGLTGQKSGLSESKETQLKNMFGLTSLAIRKLALQDYAKYKKLVLRQRRRQQGDSTSEDILSEDEYLSQHPERKPVIVIDKFAGRADGDQDFIFKMISEWSAQLVQSNLAHVIILTHDVGSMLHLTSALPNQVMKLISLSDASQRLARHYVLNQLNKESQTQVNELDSCLEPLGGRMLDLQAFVRRMRSGEAPGDALEEMVSQASEQITTFFLLASLTQNSWSTAQVWLLIKLLAKQESISYETLCHDPLFKSPDSLSILSTLEKHDLISLISDKGVLNTVLTGRPLYKAAFRSLVEDPKIFRIYEEDLYNKLIALENAKIAKLEDEFAKLASVDARLVRNRLDYVLNKIVASTDKITDYEEKISGLSSKKSSWF